jgi:hypothetical protein
MNRSNRLSLVEAKLLRPDLLLRKPLDLNVLYRHPSRLQE